MSRTAKHWQRGDLAPARELTSVDGSRVVLPDPSQNMHLQFRRFAGCPVCDLHLRSIARRHDEIEAAGVREVVVFHSTAEELRRHGAHELPFAVIADPAKRLYAEFGVESAPRALLDPRAWIPLVRAIAASSWRMVLGKSKPPASYQEHGRLGLPADLLIGRDGRVLAAKYGEYVYDQWSADELLVHARMATVPELSEVRVAPSA
jgi:peroxiredoxin